MHKVIKMRKLLICLFLLLTTLIADSCHYMDYDEIQKYQGSMAWGDRYRIRDALVGLYGMITNLNTTGSAPRSTASDDAVEANPFSSVHEFNDGRWSAINTVDDYWYRYYYGIRGANDFLEHYSIDSLDSYKYNDDYNQIAESFSSYPFQARFMRALFHFRLLKRYEHIPIVTHTLSMDTVNHLKPSSYEEVTNFIVSEMDDIAFRLPVDYNKEPFKETGRATRGAALSLKAKALLFAASPLHNPTNDVSKWEAAAEAYHDIIDKGWYTLDPDFNNLFNTTKSPGLIFTYRFPTTNYFERDNFPIGFEGSNENGVNPSQNLVDAFEMQATGLPIDNSASGYDAAYPYKGRDPRLAETVLYNNSVWKDRKVEIWDGGKDGPPIVGATKTGYYLKKRVVENVDLLPDHTTTANHTIVVFRYGGTLLSYAEAMNEAYGPENDPKGYGMTALEAVDKIRARSNMPGFPSGMTKADFRKKIHNERRVEMAFENQRFWDIRRWKIGPSTQDIKGVEITKSGNNFTYKIKTVEHRQWDDKMYLYPIPQSELFLNKDLKQNPGW